jgi:glutathione peroxidase
MNYFLLAALAFLPLSLQAGPMTFHSLDAVDSTGKPVHLSGYKGKAVLVVNVASKCGFTKQYAGLEALYREYKDKGLVILGFPSNEFGGQEPGTQEEILAFCQSKYDVTFPILEKTKVKKGEGQSPVYQFLTAGHGEPKWNFHKYLVGKDGQVIAEYPSKVAPESPELRQAIDAALAR